MKSIKADADETGARYAISEWWLEAKENGVPE